MKCISPIPFIATLSLSTLLPWAAAAHSAVEPAPRRLEKSWTDRQDLLNKRAAEAGEKAQVVFIGDSITQGWEKEGKEVWKKYYSHRNAVNLGIGGDRTQHVLWRLDNGNSGVQFRSKQLKDAGDNKWVVGGYQADIADNPYLGILYEEKGPRQIAAEVGQKVTLLPDKQKKIEKIGDPKEIKAGVNHKDWNEYVITAKGNHITQKLNGKTTVEVIDEDEKNRAMEGILALQIHVGPPMRVQFKDITLKVLE